MRGFFNGPGRGTQAKNGNLGWPSCLPSEWFFWRADWEDAARRLRGGVFRFGCNQQGRGKSENSMVYSVNRAVVPPSSGVPQRLQHPLLVAAKAQNSTTQPPRSVIIEERGLRDAEKKRLCRKTRRNGGREAKNYPLDWEKKHYYILCPEANPLHWRRTTSASSCDGLNCGIIGRQEREFDYDLGDPIKS